MVAAITSQKKKIKEEVEAKWGTNMQPLPYGEVTKGSRECYMKIIKRHACLKEWEREDSIEKFCIISDEHWVAILRRLAIGIDKQRNCS